MTVAILIELFIIIVFGFVIFSFLIPMFRGAPYASTHKNAVRRMIEAAYVVSGEKAADLGSGDGRIVMALARMGAEAHGYEINPILVWWSRRRIKKAGLERKAFIHKKSFWKEDLSQYTLVTVFCARYLMNGLGEKLQKELRSRSRVVSNYFRFPNWKPAYRKENVHVYIKE